MHVKEGQPSASQLVKPFITTALEYKAILLKLQKIVCVATHFLVMSPYSRDFL